MKKVVFQFPYFKTHNMMQKDKKLCDELGDIEKIVTEFCKHEILLSPVSKKCKPDERDAREKAYKEMAKALDLPNVEAVKLHIQTLKRICNNRMRQCVRVSLSREHSVGDALRYAPDWLKKLDKPLKLLDRAIKMESMINLKYSSAPRRMNHLMWELLLCAERTAAKASPPLDSADALKSCVAINDYAEAMELGVGQVHGIWSRFYEHAMLKLTALINVGDCPERLNTCKRFTLQDWRVVDIAIIYDIEMRVIHEQNFRTALTLHPMILLFKLMVAAKEKIDQINAGKLKSYKSGSGCQKEQSGAQTGTNKSSESPSISETKVTTSSSNVSESNVTTPQIIITTNLKSEDEPPNATEKTNTRGPNEYETAAIWALVHVKYTNCGRSASVVLLQKRWYELKQQARSLLQGLTPVPLLLAIAKRFPFILTEELPSWSELVRNKQVFRDSDLESYKIELFQIDLEIPDIDENVLFDELYDWSDDEIEIINDKKEVITVIDSEDEDTNINTNSKKPKLANPPADSDINKEETILKLDENTSKINEDDNCIKKLESLDPTITKIKIIFEDDSDSDVNDFVNSSDKSKVLGAIGNSDDNLKSFNNTNNNIVGQSSKGNCEDEDIKNLALETEELTKSILESESNKSAIIEQLDDINIKLEIDEDDYDSEVKNIDVVESNLLNSNTSQGGIEDTNRFNKEVDSNAIKAEIDVCDSSKEDSSVECENNDDISDADLKEPQSSGVDEKLVKLAHVVLTPLEDIDAWNKYSKDDCINCRRFSIRNFEKPLHITSMQLAKCRPYVATHRGNRNGISNQKQTEIYQIHKSLIKKRRFLTKYLRLPRTYFTLEFWNERNIALLELCKPVFVKLERIARSVKTVELTDIDEVRRINKTILTAQVAPITGGKNDPNVMDSTSTPLPTPSETPVQTRNISTNTNEEPDPDKPCVSLLRQNDVKEMIKKIVRKGVIVKLPDPVIVLFAKNDTEFEYKQKALDYDIREMSSKLFKRSIIMEKKRQKKNKKKGEHQNNELTLDPNLNCLKEWQRQKSRNLKYFNFQPADDGKSDSDQDAPNKEIKRKAKKKLKKTKTAVKDTQDNVIKQQIVTNSKKYSKTISSTNKTVNDATATQDNIIKQKNVTKSKTIDPRNKTLIDATVTQDNIIKQKNVTKSKTIDPINITLNDATATQDNIIKQKNVTKSKNDSRTIDPINITLNDATATQDNIIKQEIVSKPKNESKTIDPGKKTLYDATATQDYIIIRKIVTKSKNESKTLEPSNKTLNDVATKDLENNYSTYICDDLNKSDNESDSERDRLVINLDAETDVGLKRKSSDTETDAVCKISKVESKADSIEIKQTSTASNVIDLCEDSYDNKDINKHASSNVVDGNLNLQNRNESPNNVNKAQIKIKVVRNAIEINGTDNNSDIPENKNGEVITFLSKVAAKIQEKNMSTATPTPATNTNNSTVYYVVKSLDKNNTPNVLNKPNILPQKITSEISSNKTNAYTQPLNINTDTTDASPSVTATTSPLYYVIKIPDDTNGPTTALVSPLPEPISPSMTATQHVPSIPVINTVQQQIIQQTPIQSNLLMYPQNLGQIYNTYENNLTNITSTPVQRINSMPMPIKAVASWPNQNVLKTEPSPWPNTYAPQELRPAIVSSGSSVSEIKKGKFEDRNKVKPKLNKPTTHKNKLKATQVTSQRAQDQLIFPSIRPKDKRRFKNDSFS